MNLVFICAQVTEKPREVFTGPNSTAVKCNLLIPPVGNKAPTPIEITMWGKSAERSRELEAGAHVYVHGARLRYDLNERKFSLERGSMTQVSSDQFPIINTVVLSGRCIKDIDTNNPMEYKVTESNLIICNQSLSVSTGRQQADIFNFYAINGVDDKYCPAKLLPTFTRKGTGLTIHARIGTDSWIDRNSKETMTRTKIQMIEMTLAPKDRDQVPVSTGKVSAPQVTPSKESLWGETPAATGITGEPVSSSNPHGGLPSLPGQYSPASLGDDPEF
jgi:single-stranded DNA-binding protein